MHAVFLRAFIGQRPQIGRDVSLTHDDAMIVEPFSQTGGQDLSPDEGDLDGEIRCGVMPQFFHLADQGQQEGGDAEIAVDFQFHHGPDLDLRIPDAGGHQGASDAGAGLIQKNPRGRQVVGKGVHDEVPRSEPRVVQALPQPPVILFPSFRVVEGARGDIDPFEIFDGHRQKSPERRVLTVQFRHPVLLQDGNFGKIADIRTASGWTPLSSRNFR